MTFESKRNRPGDDTGAAQINCGDLIPAYSDSPDGHKEVTT
jgi:hypothetical protein